MGTPPHVNAKCPPRERRPEDALAEIAGKEQAVGSTAPQGSKKPQLRHTDVLSLVYDAILERRVRGRRAVLCQGPEHAGLGEKPPVDQTILYLGEDGP